MTPAEIETLAAPDARDIERHDAIVVGGGQAGLAASHHLAARGIEHVVLDAAARTGDAWRERWDSLHLFTPAAIDGLPGVPFPGTPGAMPSKDEMADYLAGYAERERAPIRHGVRVDRLVHDGDGFELQAGDREYLTREVIVATGFLSAPHVPAFADELDRSISQLHSSAYRNPSSIRGDHVLVVGAGNSGVEIALELRAAGRRVQLAGHSTFLPRPARIGGARLFFGFARRALTLDTPLGRRMCERMGDHGTAPVIRVQPGELLRAGVERVGRVEGARDGEPWLAGGRAVDVDAVVWCTGFRPAFEWIRIPVIEPSGLPRHIRGSVPDVPGLSFVGLPFQTSFLSPLVTGVGSDAEEIAGRIASRFDRGIPNRVPVGAGAVG